MYNISHKYTIFVLKRTAFEAQLHIKLLKMVTYFAVGPKLNLNLKMPKTGIVSIVKDDSLKNQRTKESKYDINRL